MNDHPAGRPHYFVPRIGRAGLGNELFPLLRAAEAAASSPLGVFVRPNWLKPRLGPYIRHERDKREYWRIFRAPTVADTARAVFLRAASRTPLLKEVRSRVTFESGMQGYYSRFALSGDWHRSFLRSLCRPGALSSREPVPSYIGFHIRLGDFARASDTAIVSTANNTSTPLDWYVSCAQTIATAIPGVPIVVASDGDDAELAPLLSRPNVRRSQTKNALDEMLLLSRSAALVGSRSTFTSWAAFLGEVPLLVAPGANPYQPHQRVCESANPSSAVEWLDWASDRICHGN